MDDQSQSDKTFKWAAGALGVGAVAGVVTAHRYWYWVLLAAIVLFLLLFGAYYLWWRLRARKQKAALEGEISRGAGEVPKPLRSDPNARVRLDDLRRKFAEGFEVFQSSGRDIYKLPWYVFIGEAGGGKTEAIRKALDEDIPPSLREHVPGTGGTVNMNWWFTNKGIILDTAGKMVLPEAGAAEAPEWKEFLRLLKRNRPHSPINGLFLVLSVDSLIRASADEIANKAGRLARQVELIQRALDVRFPVYMLVTFCDKLTGFREFFDSIDDPLVQHQIFGWSNPDKLDDPFRPELVSDHLVNITEQLRRRRLALLRGANVSGRLGDTTHFRLGSRAQASANRLDEVDALFALPESFMLLAPRLRRYLEIIFVAGEFSPKPVFLRGIYFTSSLREGGVLDELLKDLTGNFGEQSQSEALQRAFFLRSVFYEKAFLEKGLVTRATNTLKMIRSRRLAIFGTATLALFLLVGFAFYGKHKLRRSVETEAGLWDAASSWTGDKKPEWADGSIVTAATDGKFYVNTNTVGDTGLEPAKYHWQLRQKVTNRLTGGWIFRPISWVGGGLDKKREQAQRVLFEAGVLSPLIKGAEGKLETVVPEQPDLGRHRAAWLSLVQLQADAVYSRCDDSFIGGETSASKHLRSLLLYLTGESRTESDTDASLKTLAKVLYNTYSGDTDWPPETFRGKSRLAENPALDQGLKEFDKASIKAQAGLDGELSSLNRAADQLATYQRVEFEWLTNGDPCNALTSKLAPARDQLDAAWRKLSHDKYTNLSPGSLVASYTALSIARSNASASVLLSSVQQIQQCLGAHGKPNSLISNIRDRLNDMGKEAANKIQEDLNQRNVNGLMSYLDSNYLSSGSIPVYEMRWALYTNACALQRSASVRVTAEDIGTKWKKYKEIENNKDKLNAELKNYTGPLAAAVGAQCTNITRDAITHSQGIFLNDYQMLAERQLRSAASLSQWDEQAIMTARDLFERVEGDLSNCPSGDIGDQIKGALQQSKTSTLKSVDDYLKREAKFPLALGANPQDALTVGELKRIRGLLDALQSELGKPIWPSEVAEFKALKLSCDHYRPRVTALIDRSGDPVEWTISFEGPGGGANLTIINMLRYAKIDLGGSPAYQEVAKTSTGMLKDLGRGTGDLPITISFKYRYQDEKPAQSSTFASWGILNLISRNSNGRSDDGSAWRVQVPLTAKDGATSVTGDAVFVIKPAASGVKFPKYDDWK